MNATIEWRAGLSGHLNWIHSPKGDEKKEDFRVSTSNTMSASSSLQTKHIQSNTSCSIILSSYTCRSSAARDIIPKSIIVTLYNNHHVFFFSYLLFESFFFLDNMYDDDVNAPYARKKPAHFEKSYTFKKIL